MTTPKNATPVDATAIEEGTNCRVCWGRLLLVTDEELTYRWVHEETRWVSCPPGVSRNRPIRMPDREYDAVMAVVRWRGETLTAVMRRAVQDYIISGEAEMAACNGRARNPDLEAWGTKRST